MGRGFGVEETKKAMFLRIEEGHQELTSLLKNKEEIKWKKIAGVYE